MLEPTSCISFYMPRQSRNFQISYNVIVKSESRVVPVGSSFNVRFHLISHRNYQIQNARTDNIWSIAISFSPKTKIGIGRIKTILRPFLSLVCNASGILIGLFIELSSVRKSATFYISGVRVTIRGYPKEGGPFYGLSKICKIRSVSCIGGLPGERNCSDDGILH